MTKSPSSQGELPPEVDAETAPEHVLRGPVDDEDGFGDVYGEAPPVDEYRTSTPRGLTKDVS